jgi:hypothetical protein
MCVMMQHCAAVSTARPVDAGAEGAILAAQARHTPRPEPEDTCSLLGAEEATESEVAAVMSSRCAQATLQVGRAAHGIYQRFKGQLAGARLGPPLYTSLWGAAAPVAQFISGRPRQRSHLARRATRQMRLITAH